jgi:hypothetical protein
LNGKALSFREHVYLGDIVVKDDFVFVCVNDGVMPSQGELFSRIFTDSLSASYR